MLMFTNYLMMLQSLGECAPIIYLFMREIYAFVHVFYLRMVM